ncbi:hypothetical protein Tco_0802875 [Tanacetum coccineum]|uniref:Transmembrane protein n=1 Tax=Tanacetum coccineum TaxID=301880 RepID=A0ABQ5A430_9ASTR
MVNSLSDPNTFMDITLSLSPITPLDFTFETPSPSLSPLPPPPQPPLMGHPILFNVFLTIMQLAIYVASTTAIFLSLRDEMHFISHLDNLLTSAFAPPSPYNH